ncbi:MAG TPA: hypothetical protein DD673_15260 [Lentisphaeria bacterium]|nr:hypothetical protein [Lentisphaeria bacterium]
MFVPIQVKLLLKHNDAMEFIFIIFTNRLIILFHINPIFKSDLAPDSIGFFHILFPCALDKICHHLQDFLCFFFCLHFYAFFQKSQNNIQILPASIEFFTEQLQGGGKSTII